MAELGVLIDGYSYFEGPRWHDGRLWASDFYTHQVLAISLNGSAEKMADVPGQPSGLGWLPDGRLLVVSMRDRKLTRREVDGTLAVHADLYEYCGGHANDMVVDSAGRAYVGNFGFDVMALAPIRATTVVRADPDGQVSVVADDLLCPNGMVLTPDERTLIVAETMGQRLTAFDVEPDGSLSNRRVWAALGEPPETDDFAAEMAKAVAAPDGIALDAEGAIWMADGLGNRALRVREGGEITDEVTAGGIGIYACALGGEDGKTLFMCAAPTFLEEQARANHQSRILTRRVDVPHAGLP
jgi:sugar lactone lactonase YvrE